MAELKTSTGIDWKGYLPQIDYFWMKASAGGTT